MLAVLPFFHVTGMQTGMNMPVYLGATVVVLPRWDREVAAKLIQRYGIASWTTVPTLIIDLLSSPNIDRYNLSPLMVSGGGAAMPGAVAERLRAKSGRPYVEGYGLTETMAPTHVNPPDRQKPQCLGIPVYDTDSRIIDPQTLEELPPGEVGEGSRSPPSRD
jgi:fatty-acyl-CoA synthase